MLRLSNVGWDARGASRPLLADISLTVAPGEIVVVIGASGAGKTTLLEVAGALRRPSRGCVEISGADAWVSGSSNRARDAVAIALQIPERMFFEPTIEAEIGFALRRLRLEPSAQRGRVVEVLTLVGLDDAYLHRHPSTMSGGEQRLVALAAVLVADPTLLILDEPIAGLAGPLVARLLNLLDALRARGVAILVATHDIDSFLPIADRVIALHRGRVVGDHEPGKMFAPAEVHRLAALGVPVPATAMVGALIGSRERPPAGRPTAASLDGEIVPPPSRRTAVGGLIEPPSVAAGMLVGIVVGVAFLQPAALWTLALLAVLVTIVSAISGVGLSLLARRLAPVAALGLLAALAHVASNDEGATLGFVGPFRVSSAGVEAGARAWLRVVGPVLTAFAITGGRVPSVIARELQRLIDVVPVARRAAAGAGLAVMLVARLAPLMHSEVVRIDRAQRARGGDPGRSVAGRLRVLVSVATPAIVGTLLRAQHLALAIELRGWPGATRRPGGAGGPRGADLLWVLCAFTVLAVTAALGYGMPG